MLPVDLPDAFPPDEAEVMKGSKKSTFAPLEDFEEMLSKSGDYYNGESAKQVAPPLSAGGF